MRECWCGNKELTPFGPEYGECRTCGTLVYLKDIPPEQLLVHDDQTDFYGKKYWFEHQQEALGFDDIHTRARNDLAERNLHWLKVLLKYRLPPARVLELGCAHGSFVALLRQAGYDASGVEMSPWVVEFGQKAFDVPIYLGPVETLTIPTGSLDVIVLMDVLEHLPNPVATMSYCLQLLKPDGLLLLQTPQYKEEMNYAALVKTNGDFLEQMKSVEHPYLFSERSVARLFQQLGAEHIQFETAVFGHYDMSLLVSRVPLSTHAMEEIEAALTSTANGRMGLALLDLFAKVWMLQKANDDLSAHRDTAFSQVKILTGWVNEARDEVNLLREHQLAAEQQIETLTGWVNEARDEVARFKGHRSMVPKQLGRLYTHILQSVRKLLNICAHLIKKLS